MRMLFQLRIFRTLNVSLKQIAVFVPFQNNWSLFHFYGEIMAPRDHLVFPLSYSINLHKQHVFFYFLFQPLGYRERQRH